jgi:hypothetical protein
LVTYQIKLAFITVVTIPIATAFFSGVCPHVEPHHPRISELTPYVPMVKMTIAVYRPATLMGAEATRKPTTATHLEMVMCHVRSLNLPEDHETAIVTAPAIR